MHRVRRRSAILDLTVLDLVMSRRETTRKRPPAVRTLRGPERRGCAGHCSAQNARAPPARHARHVAKIESEGFDERLCKDRVLYGNGVYFTSETYDSARVIADVRAIHMVKDQHRYPGYQGAGGLPGLDPRARPRASCRRTSSL